ncbi:hypothetical protein TNCV_733161, partial [Trichonephila clavipes]
REIAKDIQAYSRVRWEKHVEALSLHVDNTLWRKSLFGYVSLFNPFTLKGTSWQSRDNPSPKRAWRCSRDGCKFNFEPNNHVAEVRTFRPAHTHDEVTNFINTTFKNLRPETTPTEVLSYVQRLKPRNPPDLIRFPNPVRFSTQVLDSSPTAQSNGVDSQWLYAKHEATSTYFFWTLAKAFDKIWHDGLLISSYTT